MPQHSMPLQDLPRLSLQGAKRTHKRRAKGDGPDMECTPTELLLQRPPTELLLQRPPLLKHQRLSKGKENQQFVLARRSRRKRAPPSELSWDRLPDELLLRILFYVPLQDLLRTATVCQRWRRLACDESLWHSVDLEGLTHVGPALQQVLKTGVRMLRCPRSFVEEMTFTGPLQVVVMDLSSSVIPTSSLESLMGHCRQLQYLSLEGLQLSDSITSSLSQNTNLLQLNLSGCSGFSAPALAALLQSCCSMEQLNVAWCDFSNDHVRSVVGGVSAGVTQLNLSGYREKLTLDDVKLLVSRCPRLQTLDLSDSTLLMADSLPVLRQLKDLLHLSLSRCYHIHLAALTDLDQTLPVLGLLDVFGIVSGSHLSSLKKEMPRVSINSRPFSSVARPSPACRPGGFLWDRTCRLRVQQ